jgi:hypothetical protein
VALTEQHRNTLYQGLTEAVGDEEAVAAMLSQLPAREADEPATKDFVRAEVADVRADVADARTEIARLDSKVDVGFAELEARMVQRFADVKEYVHEELRRYVLWHFVSMFVLLAAVVSAARLLR